MRAILAALILCLNGARDTGAAAQSRLSGCLNRDSPDASRTGVSIGVFPAFQQDRSAVRTATVTSGSPDDGRGADLAIFAGIWTHSSRRLPLNA